MAEMIRWRWVLATVLGGEAAWCSLLAWAIHAGVGTRTPSLLEMAALSLFLSIMLGILSAQATIAWQLRHR